MKNRKALVVLSGGQDSTTCLFWAIDKFGKENVSAIGFDYGQRHKLELECADKICKKLCILMKSFRTLHYKSAFLQIHLRVKIFPLRKQSRRCTAEYIVEGRNLLFLSYAAIYAKSRHNRPCNRCMRNRFFWLSGLS